MVHRVRRYVRIGNHVLRALVNLGKEFIVAQEIAVLGIDNDDLVCELCHPKLSSIERNFQQSGFEAADLLNRMINDKPVENNTIIIQPTHVVTRQSTNVLDIDDIDVANAVHFIRMNARKIISVDDVAESVLLSRRILEMRFRKALGRTIYQEIVRLRIEHVSQMLLETNLSITEIALDMGYSDCKHIARLFRKEKGMTPLNYRKKYGKI